MSRNRLRLFLIAIVFAAVLAYIAVFNRAPKRPANVPTRAVAIPVVKGVLWQNCTYDAEKDTDRCTIWHSDGQTIVDEVFVPYGDGPTIKQSDLIIADQAHGIRSGDDRICLRNGRILIPVSRKVDLTRFLDWLNGKRAQP
jgi:hypothetical protein